MHAAGVLYTRFNYLLTIAVVQVIAFVSTFLFGHLQNYILIMMTTFLMGLFIGISKGMEQPFIFQLWGDHAFLFLQLQCFCFNIGGVIAPMILKPFLSSFQDGNQGASLHSNLDKPYAYVSCLMSLNGLLMFLVWMYFPRTTDHPSRAHKQEEDLHGSRCGGTEDPVSDTESGATKPEINNRKQICKILVITLTAVFLHMFFGIELMVAQFLVPFVTRTELRLSKETGLEMTSTFWAIETVMTLVCTLYMPYVGSGYSIILNCVITLGGAVLLFLSANSSQALMWIAIVIIAIGNVGCYGCSAKYIEGYFRVTGIIGSVFGFVITMGECVWPSVISFYIDSNPMILPWIVLSFSVVMLVLFAIVMIICYTQLRHHQ
jgi:hypothetical protein